MRIIVTGANGQLGTDLQRVLTGYEVFPVDIEELDITDFSAVQREVGRIKPELIIHGAAFTDVDGAELHVDRAFQINAAGAQNLAATAERYGAAILYVSTDFVFDGTKGDAYTEFDDPNPLSVYGASKLAGERQVMSLTNRFYICRTAWLYGRHGHNFVKTMLRLGEERGAVSVVEDQIGSPTFATDLAAKLVEIGTSGRYGVYHTTNSGAVSWYAFAKKIFEAAAMDVEVKPIKTSEMQRPAPRPAYSVLRNLTLELQGMEPMRPWEEGLADYFK